MEINVSKLDKAVKLSIIAGTLIVALSVAYYLAIFLPKKEAVRLEQKKQEQEVKSNAKKYCSQWAVDKAMNANLQRGGSNDRYQKADYDTYFERCLQEQGVEN